MSLQLAIPSPQILQHCRMAPPNSRVSTLRCFEAVSRLDTWHRRAMNHLYGLLCLFGYQTSLRSTGSPGPGFVVAHTVQVALAVRIHLKIEVIANNERQTNSYCVSHVAFNTVN